MPEATATTAAATTATTAAAATTATSTTTAAAATAANAPWHGFTEPADIEYVKNKGWQGPQDTIKSYQGAEKLIGRDPSTLLVMPRADDPAGFLQVMDKLGRPATPDKYEFAKPADGMALDEGYVNWARSTFHELGLPAQTVKALSGKHNEYIKGVLAKQDADYRLSVDTDKKALAGEWRDGFERKMNAASAAARGLGFTPEMIDAMERTVGYAGTYKFFSNLGTKMGEDNFVTGGDKNRNFGGVTPEEAKAQWEAMKIDPVAKAALNDTQHPGHEAAKLKQTNLFKIMYPA